MNAHIPALENGVCGEMGNDKISTSISVNKEIWNEFCSIVVRKHGNRYISNILEDLIKEYIKKNGGMQFE